MINLVVIGAGEIGSSLIINSVNNGTYDWPVPERVHHFVIHLSRDEIPAIQQTWVNSHNTLGQIRLFHAYQIQTNTQQSTRRGMC